MNAPATPEIPALPLTGMRGAIARAMTAGWQIPRVVHHANANLSRLEMMRRQEAEAGRKKSITPYLLRAVALCLQDHPRLNAHLTDNEIRVQPDINLGLAVSVTDGLMVPVIRQADALSVDDLAASAARLAQGAREGSLSAGTYQRGTFTVTNLGMTAIDAATQAKRLGAKEVTLVYRRTEAEKPCTDVELDQLFKRHLPGRFDHHIHFQHKLLTCFYR